MSPWPDPPKQPNPGQPPPQNPQPAIEVEPSKLPSQNPVPATTGVRQWLASKGGFAHVAAVSIAGLFTLYYSVPPFQHVVQTAYLDTPPWAHNVIEAALGIYAFYKNPQKEK